MQILDDEGKPMFPSTKGQWLQDTAAQRAKVLSGMVNWRSYSNSSPVEGIGAAVQGWWSADKKISVYVIGDDFTGPSVEAALAAVRKYNPDRPPGPAQDPHPRHRHARWPEFSAVH